MGQETTKKIRLMTLTDIPAVMALDGEAFPVSWPRPAWEEELTKHGDSYLCLEVNGALAGYAGFWWVLDEVQVTRVAIGKAFRGQGLGELLMNGAKAQAQELGSHFMTLEVRESNTVARKLYEKLGFKSLGIRPHYYENKENAIMMEWQFK
jgi:ribosomal-protein-alanine N-acetyltransferase